MASRIGSGIIKNKLILQLDASDAVNYTLSNVEVLVVAGGGGGGWDVGGGGGGGGVCYSKSYPVAVGAAYTVTVGQGGVGANANSGAGRAGSNGRAGDNGGNSIFGTITALGGGGGGGWNNVAGSSGGSGGGQTSNSSDGAYSATQTSGAFFTGYGNPGGISARNSSPSDNQYSGASGGGGAGGPGGGGINNGTWTLNSALAGFGGPGLPFNISGTTKYYGGGGGASSDGSSYTGIGGIGGGGAGGEINGEANTGGGGGGGGLPTNIGGTGGSGIVIVRYPGPQKATGGNTITQVNGYTIHTFTSSGTFTPSSAPSNNASANGLQDLSGNNNLVAVQSNGPLYSTLGGGSILFDGTNDGLNLGTDPSINLLTGDFAICSWFYRENTGNDYGNLIGNYYTNSVATTNDWQFMIRRSTSPMQIGAYRVGSGYLFGGSQQSLGAAATLNTWINLVVTRIGVTISLYVNGSLIATTTESSPSQWGNGSTSNIYIGVDGNGSSEPFGGRVASVLIYKDKGLTLSEVLQNFNAQRGRFGI